MRPAIYDSSAAEALSLEGLIRIFSDLGISRLIYKPLSPNDNSKNQPYMASHLTDLGLLPTGEIVASRSDSRKTSNAKRRIKYTAPLDYSWVSAHGEVYPAPGCKLIYYPQYPEVRLSGFLAGCRFDMGGWMAPESKGRAQGRVLFLGIHPSGKIYAYLATPQSRVAREVRESDSVAVSGVFFELALKGRKVEGNSRDSLLVALTDIHNKGWIPSKRLNASGMVIAYKAQNGGGFTLEAELGIIPNGIAQPDFLGWEIKQFGVDRCEKIESKVLTIMTPEPDGGFYVEGGVEAFVRKYGYKSPTTADRYDFTGRHQFGTECEKSKLKLVTIGYDPEGDTITDADGYVGLIDRSGATASAWSFGKIMKHWKEKHAKAAYIPSISDHAPDNTRLYMYCSNIRLFTGTSFNHLLKAITSADVYYDPGINLKRASARPETKRRSQFRIKSGALGMLYTGQENVDLSSA